MPAQISLVKGKFPAGMTMADAETALSAVKGELGQLFQQWGLTKAVVVLQVEQGKVKTVQVKSHEGKGYKKEALSQVLQKIAFAASMQGPVELELVYR